MQIPIERILPMLIYLISFQPVHHTVCWPLCRLIWRTITCGSTQLSSKERQQGPLHLSGCNGVVSSQSLINYFVSSNWGDLPWKQHHVSEQDISISNSWYVYSTTQNYAPDSRLVLISWVRYNLMLPISLGLTPVVAIVQLSQHKWKDPERIMVKFIFWIQEEQGV